MYCPLCKSDEIKKIETVSSKRLLILYKKLTKIDFSYLLDDDLRYCECQNCKLKYYDPLITGDETFYNTLQQFDWYYMHDKDEFLQAKKYINSDDRVLEVGSGKGAFAKYLPNQHYVGLDFSVKAKDMAAKDGVLIKNEMVQDYAAKNPESVDIVVSFQVLEHVSDPKSFIEAKLCALAIGGKMIIAVPSEDSFLKYVDNNILNMPPHHVTRWSDETLKFVADKYNLELLDIYHEKLQDVHKQYYLNTLIQNSLPNNKFFSISLVKKFFSMFTRVFSRFLLKGLTDEMLPNGHNVLAVYRKK
ncbi:MAG: SAM-dependent methyltransferase [Congregibacter sp.]|jgi:SAM-dependent methyltransferase